MRPTFAQPPEETRLTRRTANAALLGGAALAALGCETTGSRPRGRPADDRAERRAPVAVSTWTHGLVANRVAVPILAAGGSSLDAVESGCRAVEADCPDRTVGLDSRPDRDGHVTLDASIMTGDGRAGAVAFVEGVAHPISLARLVMERTPHVLLVGAGAERFARESGIEVAPRPLAPDLEREWRKWLEERRYEPVVNIENHDTISMLAIDREGRLTAGSTTSGLAYKMHGRVGDSPIIGAGIYAESPVGGAVCTGLGETVMRTLGAYAAVDEMRRGATPQEACEAAVRRIAARNGDPSSFQVGMLALDHRGRVGAFAVQKGFNLAVDLELRDAPSLL